jgi:trehalose 6-phosphate synthase
MLGYLELTRETRNWFAADLALRSRLAVASATESLSSHWTTDQKGLSKTLADITRDERIMCAAACSLGGAQLAATDSYPGEFSCRSVLGRKQAEAPATSSWSMTAELPSGRVNLSVTVVDGGGGPLGAVILVHDLSYLERREATTRNLLLVAFFVLSLGASLFTLLAARFAWKGWTLELRRALSGKATREFQPLVRDVRELVDRLAQEHDQNAQSGEWSPARLHSTLTQHPHGERIVILANREPYIHEKSGDGYRVVHPASGLVTALEPVMRACSGVWVAHGSGSADRDTVDSLDHVKVPPGEGSYVLRRVWLSEEEESGYYYGFSNEGLWPLCHVAHARPVFRAEDWKHYVRVIPETEARRVLETNRLSPRDSHGCALHERFSAVVVSVMASGFIAPPPIPAKHAGALRIGCRYSRQGLSPIR